MADGVSLALETIGGHVVMSGSWQGLWVRDRMRVGRPGLSSRTSLEPEASFQEVQLKSKIVLFFFFFKLLQGVFIGTW